MFQRGLLMLLWMPLAAFALVQETGTLTGFLMDSCATCAYDNWQAHVSEKIARAGYNDYGPAHLDPQTNGFGGFTYIPTGADGDSTLARWRAVFRHALQNEWLIVDSLIQLQDTVWRYELVEFSDTDSLRDYYIIRERLDSAFVDTNGSSDPTRHVLGGFRTGWGVYVFNPAARFPHAVMQLPHPEDDFVSIPVGIQSFQQSELGVLMIAGAGREVMWDTTRANYTNSYSYSDPTRNARTPFAEFSKELTDQWNSPPINPLVIVQLHSYDHAAHLGLTDIQATAYHNDSRPNPPLRDQAYHRDLIHALPLYPVTTIDGDNNIVTVIDDYIGLYSNPQYSYYGADTTITIRSIQDLLGAPDNIEAEYCHIGHDAYRNTENFIHVELDEYPDDLWTPVNWTRWLPGTPPTNWNRYAHALDYYQPFVQALDSALTWHAQQDTFVPELVQVTGAYSFADGRVAVMWSDHALDTHFDTYEVYYDTNEVTLSSPRKSRTNQGYSALGDMFTDSIVVSGLVAPGWNYSFAVRAKDMAGNVSELSTVSAITDGAIADLGILVDGDSLRLFWTALPIDSVYEVREYLQMETEYTWLGTTADTQFAFAPAGIDGLLYRYMVKRIVRD